MFCKNCGSEIPDGTLFCSKCGKATAETNQWGPTNYQPYTQQPRNPQDGRGLSITALVLGICGVALCWLPSLNVIVLACGILGIVFGYIGRKKSIAAYGKASGLATAGFVLGIIGTAICGIGVLSCTVCVSCASCGTRSLWNSLY